MNHEKKKAIFNVLKQAIQRETDAFNYYHKASKKSPYSETEALFIQLAEEERKHRVFLTRELQRIEKLMVQETEDHFVGREEVRYALPKDIPFKKLDTSLAVDLAAVCLPTELLGGDYLDTVSLGGEEESPTLGIFLYDVMGHGLKATQLKALAKRAFGQLKDSWIQGQSSVDMNQPQNMMTDFNRKLVDFCQSNRFFVSAFYGVVDPVGETLTYTSAGQEPPILIKREGEYIHFSETELLLGFNRDLVYSEVTIPINVGNILVLYSDGITEAMNVSEEMFERERLIGVVQKAREYSSHEIIRHIFDALRNFLGDQPITDEITLAVVKLRELKQR